MSYIFTSQTRVKRFKHRFPRKVTTKPSFCRIFFLYSLIKTIAVGGSLTHPDIIQTIIPSSYVSRVNLFDVVRFLVARNSYLVNYRLTIFHLKLKTTGTSTAYSGEKKLVMFITKIANICFRVNLIRSSVNY
jgi:hypothetical protein